MSPASPAVPAGEAAASGPPRQQAGAEPSPAPACAGPPEPVSPRARVWAWATAHPRAADALGAAGVLCMVVGAMWAGPHSERHHPGPEDLVLAVLACSALAWRRLRPRTVLAVACALTVVYVVAVRGANGPVSGSVVVALFALAVHTDRQTTVRAAVPVCLGLTAVCLLFGADPWYAAQNLSLFAWTGMAAAAGDAVRSHRAYVAAIRERAERAERTREQEAKRRVTEERMRIARELHDVVAHHIALVNVQAGVASHVMDSRPDQARQALAHVRQASRSALDELRATVGLLRQSGDPEVPTEPAPGLRALDQLVDGFRSVGLAVEVSAADGLGPLPASVDLTAYRVIQESLTNAHKHAGPGARARVRIERGAGAVEVTVRDDGIGALAAGDGTGGGYGIVGMRERAAALGGSCVAGPGPDGGFQVTVRLPVPPGPSPAAGATLTA